MTQKHSTTDLVMLVVTIVHAVLSGWIVIGMFLWELLKGRH